MIVTKIELVRLPIPISTQLIMVKNGSVLYFDCVFFVIFKPQWGIALLHVTLISKSKS